MALFHCKDRDSFEDALRENDVIRSREERAAVCQMLSETKHAKLLLKTDQPVAYNVRPGRESRCKHVGSTPAEHPDLSFGCLGMGAYEYFRLRSFE